MSQPNRSFLVSRCSPGSWTDASSSCRKQTMLVWVPLLAYLFM